MMNKKTLLKLSVLAFGTMLGANSASALFVMSPEPKAFRLIDITKCMNSENGSSPPRDARPPYDIKGGEVTFDCETEQCSYSGITVCWDTAQGKKCSTTSSGTVDDSNSEACQSLATNCQSGKITKKNCGKPESLMKIDPKKPIKPIKP